MHSKSRPRSAKGEVRREEERQGQGQGQGQGQEEKEESKAITNTLHRKGKSCIYAKEEDEQKAR
jgi:hypothetical protein